MGSFNKSEAMTTSKVRNINDYRDRKSKRLQTRIEVLQSQLIQAVIALEFPKKRMDEVGVAHTKRIYDRMVADLSARLKTWSKDA